MKRFALLSIMTLASACVSQQSASAWHNFKFSVGMNVQWTSGNNCLLWGLFRNGPESHPTVVYHQGGGYGYRPMYHPGAYGPGCTPYGCPAPAPVPAPAPDASKKTSAPGTLPPSLKQAYYQSWPGGYGFQPVAYYPSYYTPPAYYYGYSHYSAPYYWYAR